MPAEKILNDSIIIKKNMTSQESKNYLLKILRKFNAYLKYHIPQEYKEAFQYSNQDQWDEDQFYYHLNLLLGDFLISCHNDDWFIEFVLYLRFFLPPNCDHKTNPVEPGQLITSIYLMNSNNPKYVETQNMKLPKNNLVSGEGTLLFIFLKDLIQSLNSLKS